MKLTARHCVITLASLVATVLVACSSPMGTDAGPTDTRRDIIAVDTSMDTPVETGATCATDTDCSDGLFCDGVERCMPGAPGADARGCVHAVPASPCSGTQTCNESMQRCESGCGTPDGDGDGHRSSACGGDDCDDADPNRFPGNAEVCDTMAHDEDCDSSTYGFRDGDGDGYGDVRCCNVDMSSMRICGDDCNDMRPNQHPSLAETCDGLDNNCDGMVDEGVMLTFYRDADNDGYGTTDTTMTAMGCSAPTGFVASHTDCDDTNQMVNPATSEVCDPAAIDENCDGVANPPSLCMCVGTASRPCSLMGACAAGTERCSSGSWGACSIAPVAEACNGVDDNCNGVVDDGVSITCYADNDNDGYPVAGAMAVQSCPTTGREFVGGCPANQTNRAPMGTAIDCNDADSSVSPAAIELCDAGMVDENCDGMANPPSQCVCSGSMTRACPLPGACAAGTQMCMGGAWGTCSIIPITESCNGIDDNCDGTVDEGLSVTCYPDDDDDTYPAAGAVGAPTCPVAGRASVGGCPTSTTNRAPATGTIDCAPMDSSISPAAPEVCDMAMVDENCSGAANEGCTCTTGSNRNCPQPGACAAGQQSCIGGTWGTCSITAIPEACNGIDDNCDGTVDEGLTSLCYPDSDGDTYAPAGASSSQQCSDPARSSVGGCPNGFTNRAPISGSIDCDDFNVARNPTAAETCNTIDDNCDGMVDEGLRVTCYADTDGDTYAPAGASPSQMCPDPSRPLVGGCGIGLTNRAPTAGNIDCADSDNNVNPSITETCNSIDDNCNGVVDETLRVTCYPDMDGDAYSPSTTASTHCPDGARMAVGGCPSGYTNRAGTSGQADCNDANQLINPTAAEVCDAAMVDENCDGMANPAALCSCSGSATQMCPLPGACSAGTQTCNSGMWGPCSIMPTTEICDSVDNNCDGSVDEGLRVICYTDADDDGYPASGAMAMASTCPVAGRPSVGGCPVNTTNRAPTLSNIDCQPANPAVHPGVTDLCNGVDDDCNGTPDDAATANPACAAAAPYGYGTCRSGACVLIACYNGRADCDGNPANGCEVDVTTATNCGACGNACGVGGACLGGRCEGVLGVATGGSHACAWREGGAVVCWGQGNYGQLGNGMTANSVTPVAVMGISGTVTSVVVGATSSCALATTRTGTAVYCWGQGSSGQLGNGMNLNSSTAVQVTGLTTATEISMGSYHTCARLSDSTIRCWGQGFSGQLGNGGTANASTPVAVSGITTALGVAAGGSHTCARIAGNAVRCWGSNSDGQLGNGTMTNSTTPVVTSGVVAYQLSAGFNHTCARTAAGQISCWGQNNLGQIGDGTMTDRLVPTAVSFTFNTPIDITAGYSHSCAIDREPTNNYRRLFCWGNNGNGQLGDGTMTSRTLPTRINATGDIVNIATSANAFATCGRRLTDQIACWGSNNFGQVGNGSTGTSQTTPATVVNLLTPTLFDTGVGGAGGGSCARLPNGRVACWGSNTYGQLGDGTTTSRNYPALVSNLTDATGLSVGENFVCALRAGGQVSCWGINSFGQLGDGSTTSATTPVVVSGLTGAVEIATGASLACARRTTGDVVCWGINSSGQCGNGTGGAARLLPGTAVNGISTAVDVTAGWQNHACARLQNGTVQCWGSNSAGEMGIGTSSASIYAPTTVPGIDDALNFDAGQDFTCVERVTGGRTVSCWGRGTEGEIGDGGMVQRNSPITVPGVTGVTGINAGQQNACANSGGTLRCWGANTYGQIDPSAATHYTPFTIATTGFIAVGPGLNTTCGIRSVSGAITEVCWGYNGNGDCGTGTNGGNLPISTVRGLP